MFLSTVMDSSHQMMFSTALPAELVLQIISYFGLSTVSLLSRLNKSWQNFVQENESTIYHAVAFFEGYIPAPSWTLDDPRTRGLYSDRTWFGVTKWKEFCALSALSCDNSPLTGAQRRRSTTTTDRKFLGRKGAISYYPVSEQ